LRVDFYHLTSQPLERVLPAIAERVVAQGERLLIVADDDSLLDRLDHELWRYRPESFLPHGRASDQPVWLSRVIDAPERVANLAIVDGIWRDAVRDFTRIFFLFDQQMIENAREIWRSLAGDADMERHYWKQDERGRWAEGP
jgi:DNA polymerase III subunit chi